MFMLCFFDQIKIIYEKKTQHATTWKTNKLSTTDPPPPKKKQKTNKNGK